MKFKILFLSFLIGGAAVFQSCRKEELSKVTYRYVNESLHPIELFVFQNREEKFKESISSGGFFEIYKEGEGGTPPPIDGDSAYVLFKNPDKFLVYHLNINSGNPEGIFAYQSFDSELISETKNRKTYLRIFTFTEEEYKNAEPL